jgi:hypothetical protein
LTWLNLQYETLVLAIPNGFTIYININMIMNIRAFKGTTPGKSANAKAAMGTGRNDGGMMGSQLSLSIYYGFIEKMIAQKIFNASTSFLAGISHYKLE